MYARSTQQIVTLSFFALLGLSSSALPASAQLPDGPGKDETMKVCGTCHPATTAASVRLTRDGWQAKITDMVSRGAMGTDEELAAILEYLAAHFAGEANERLRRESTAFIEYRKKVNGFKSLEDMKDIPGVPFKKIESKKDRIAF
jgi:competence protein ComEA